MITPESLLSALKDNWVAQPDKPEETPEAALRALWFAAAGDPRGIARLEGILPALDAAGEQHLRELVRQRIGGTPLAHLTGRQSFLGLELLAGPEALIPRRETEILAAGALARLQEIVRMQGRALVLDICTGAGNVALALAAGAPGAVIVGSDLSLEAAALAGQNARHLGLEDRVSFRSGDLFAPFEEDRFLGRIDLVTCNPPYISSAKVLLMSPEIAGHEPRLAFDGGPFGVNILMRLIAQAPRFLKPSGWLGFEVGAGQSAGVLARLQRSPAFTDIQSLEDSSGEIRAFLARHLAA